MPAKKKSTTKKVTKKKVAKKKVTKTTATERRKAMLKRVYAMTFASIYPLYLDKVEKKGRTQKELDKVLCWLTGYTPAGLKKLIKSENDLETFIKQAKFHPKARTITGSVCGVKVQEVKEPVMKKLRYMDKLVDELARGRAMEKVLRT